MIGVWVISVAALALVVLIVLGYQRVNIPRLGSFEGIDSFEVADAYNRISRWPQFRFLRHLIVSELKGYHPHGVLVDVGCGPGYLVAVIAKSFPNLRIVGVDIAQEMISQAASTISSTGTGGMVEFRLGSAQELPFEDNTIDFVVSTLSLHHWSLPELVLREIHRVLKPQGQFLIFDLRRDARRCFYWLLNFAQTIVVPTPLSKVNEPTGSARAAYTPHEIETILAGSMFRSHAIKQEPGWMFVWGRKD
jgi:ubiquinone/menaquinone biosynthesis C-methylase UbiE